MNRFCETPLTGAIAIMLGIGALLLGTAIAGPGAFSGAAWMAVPHFAAALALGIVWPRPSWAWGIWVTLPLAAYLLLSIGFMGFTGDVTTFLLRDLLPLIVVAGAALSGGVVGKRVRERFSQGGAVKGA